MRLCYYATIALGCCISYLEIKAYLCVTALFLVYLMSLYVKKKLMKKVGKLSVSVGEIIRAELPLRR